MILLNINNVVLELNACGVSLISYLGQSDTVMREGNKEWQFK